MNFKIKSQACFQKDHLVTILAVMADTTVINDRLTLSGDVPLVVGG